MAKFKVTERILETRVIVVEADDEDDAYEKASDIDYQDWDLTDLDTRSTQIEEV